MERQNDKKSNSSGHSTALLTGATILGAGIGAALYHFFSKPEEEKPLAHTSHTNPKTVQKAKDPTKSGELQTCSICFEDVSEDILILSCGHHFHWQCVFPWFNKDSEHMTCPYCRKPHKK